jgi:hypothetical protein
MHAIGDIGKKSPQKEMIMSVYEAIGKTYKGIFQAGIIDFPQENIPVIVIVENGFPSVPSGDDVIHCILK